MEQYIEARGGVNKIKPRTSDISRQDQQPAVSSCCQQQTERGDYAMCYTCRRCGVCVANGEGG